MIIYPAIDIRRGLVVRLVHGDPGRQMVFSEDPLSIAFQWKENGAEWLHVVNLDGALGEDNLNLKILSQLSEVGLPIQFGGGLRTIADVRQALNAGARRVILGTMVVEHPQLLKQALEEFGPDAIVVALDARGGYVATRGWQETTTQTPLELGLVYARQGLIHALYTDINRDGDLSGVNVKSTAALAKHTGLQVIASGGVASLEDIRALHQSKAKIAGVVIGKALYTGKFALSEALKTVRT